MDRVKLQWVAEGVLSPKELSEFGELLEEGMFNAAQGFLLIGIDGSYFRKVISREEAEGFYKILNLPPEDACRFREGYYE